MKVVRGYRTRICGLTSERVSVSLGQTVGLGRIAAGLLTLGLWSGVGGAAVLGQTPPLPSGLPSGSSDAASTAPTSSVASSVSPQQLNALAEALRLTANQGPGFNQDIYYGDWQVKGSSIPAWSKGCLGHSITPGQFADSPDTARSVVLCVLKDKFARELKNSDSETVAVRRMATWWRTGDGDRYREGRYATYSQTVAKVYDQQIASVQTTPAVVEPVSNTPYDRYMSEGYRFSRDNEFAQAVVYFQRALDERPGDSFATSALRDVSRKAKTPDGADVSPQDQTVEISSEYWLEVAENEAGDRTLVAPSSLNGSKSGASVAYWEYRAFRGENPVFFPVASDKPVRSALLYRVTDCKAQTTQTRVMKLYTHKREEIHQENFGSAGRLEEPGEGSSTAKAIAYACGEVNGGEVNGETSGERAVESDAVVESTN